MPTSTSKIKTPVRSPNRFTPKHKRNMAAARNTGFLDVVVGCSKLCPKCNLFLSLDRFHRSSKRGNGYQLWCKECGKQEKKASYHSYRRNRVRQLSRATQLRTKYGMSLEDYETLCAAQGRVCAICSLPETVRSSPNGVVDSLRVDHDHKTGKIRGLLCSECNFGISKFKDRPSLMRKAIQYLVDNGHEDDTKGEEMITDNAPIDIHKYTEYGRRWVKMTEKDFHVFTADMIKTAQRLQKCELEFYRGIAKLVTDPEIQEFLVTNDETIDYKAVLEFIKGLKEN